MFLRYCIGLDFCWQHDKQFNTIFSFQFNTHFENMLARHKTCLNETRLWGVPAKHTWRFRHTKMIDTTNSQRAWLSSFSPWTNSQNFPTRPWYRSKIMKISIQFWIKDRIINDFNFKFVAFDLQKQPTWHKIILNLWACGVQKCWGTRCFPSMFSRELVTENKSKEF